MKRFLKLAAVVLVVLVAVAGGAFAAAVWMGERKMERSVFIKVVPVPYASGAAALAQGKYLFQSRGCAECHAANGGGRVFIDDPNGMYVKGPNITTGTGGVVKDYTEGDWVRSIRHGVNPKGHALMIMPSEDYNRLTDADFAALVAYVRSLPPVAGEGTILRLPAIVKALYGIGKIPDAAEKIDHSMPPSQPVPVAVTVEHGHYVSRMCIGCHGDSLAGGPIPGAPPDWPPAANLTPAAGSVMPRYDTLEKFVTMMRSGKRADGTAVKVMPFEMLRAMNDTDLAALHVYLKTLAPATTGR